MRHFRHAFRWSLLLLCAGLLVTFADLASAQTPSSLAFAGPDALALTLPDAGGPDTVARTVFLRNESGAPVDVSFGLVWGEVGEAPAGALRVEPATATLPAGDVAAFRVTLAAGDLGAGSGYLVARPGSSMGVMAAMLPLTVSAAPTPAFAGIVLPSLALATAVVLIGAIWLRVAGLDPLTTWIYGQAGWSPKDSWMSNLALAAGLAQPFLDAETPGLRGEGYLVVVAVFGLLLLAAPLLYNAFLVPVVAEDDAEPPAPVRGPVWAFLFTTLLTLWGVLGEFLAGYRLLQGASLATVVTPAESAFFLRVLPLIIGLLLVAYTLLTLYRQVVSQHVPRADRGSVRLMMGDEVAGDELPAPAPRWALL